MASRPCRRHVARRLVREAIERHVVREARFATQVVCQPRADELLPHAGCSLCKAR